MIRRFVVFASVVAIMGGVLGGCWTDPDSPKTWLGQINESPFKRKEALVNLYRLHETMKALSEKKGKTGDKYKKKLKAFHKTVNPALVKAFDKKIRKKYESPQEILEHLIMFEADVAAPLYLRILQEYVDDNMDKYGDQDTQEGLVAKALSGLGNLAERGKAPPEAMDVIASLIDRICGSGKSTGVIESLDQRSFIRNSVVKTMPKLIKSLPQKKKVAGKLLAKVLDYGFKKGQVQDPMVNIFAARSLGDVGDTSPRIIEAMVTSLYRKGRGRSFHPYSTVSLAKLPADSDGHHPAVEPLVWLMKGDPWKRVLAGLKVDEKAEKKNKEAIVALTEKLTALKDMPPCPKEIPAKYNYVCEIFWASRKEKWEAKEPGVVELNSIITLREIGDTGKDHKVLSTMLSLYSSKALEKKWFKKLEKDDRWLPRVQNQRMQIKGYGRDMNIRMEFLFAAGRLGKTTEVQGLKEELIRSLNWSGDPGSMMKGAEAIARSPYNEDLLRTLIGKISKVQSWIGYSFKHRMFKHAGWSKAQKQCDAAKPKLDKLFQECTSEGKTAEECFKRFREKFWLPEVKKIVGYFEPNDVKDYQHEYCADKDDKKTEPACKETLSEQDKKQGVPKCNEWGPCNAEKFYTCLDGDQELRINYATEAMRAATPKELPLLKALKPEMFLRPPSRSEKSMPKKDTTYFDPTDLELLKNRKAILPKKMATARRKKAIETINLRLCEMGKRLTVLEKCKYDINCYIATLKGENVSSYTDRDCTKKGFPTKEMKKMDWRRKEKAAYMLAVIGSKPGKKDMAIRALCASYEDASKTVRKAILLALDRIADSRHADQDDMGKKIIGVVEDETSRRVKGVWQINRDARSCIGRMSRRKASK